MEGHVGHTPGMTLLAAIADGHAGLSEVLMLLAFFIFMALVVIAFFRRSFESALLPGGLACMALAFFVT